MTHLQFHHLGDVPPLDFIWEVRVVCLIGATICLAGAVHLILKAIAALVRAFAMVAVGTLAAGAGLGLLAAATLSLI